MTTIQDYGKKGMIGNTSFRFSALSSLLKLVAGEAGIGLLLATDELLCDLYKLKKLRMVM